MWHWITHHLQLLLLAAAAFWLLRAALRSPAGGATSGSAGVGLVGAVLAMAGFVLKTGWKLVLAAGALLALLIELMPDSNGGDSGYEEVRLNGDPVSFDPVRPWD